MENLYKDLYKELDALIAAIEENSEYDCAATIEQFMDDHEVGMYEFTVDHTYDTPGSDGYSIAIVCIGRFGELILKTGYFEMY